jgi:hypothetical protein
MQCGSDVHGVMQIHRIDLVTGAIGAPDQALALFQTRVWHRTNPMSAEEEAPEYPVISIKVPEKEKKGTLD